MEKLEKTKKLGISLYIVLFFVVYGLLQLGFTGLYTYTTIGSLFTCLMYFSIYVLFFSTYVFFKFRKKEVDEVQIKSVLDRIFVATTVIIFLLTFIQIYSYVNNMYGTQKLKDDYNVYTSIVNKEEKVENEIVQDDTMEAVQEMIAYDEYSKELDSIYAEMKDKMGIYILFRIVTDVINVLISYGIIYILGNKIINKVFKRKDENESIEDNVVDGESK